MSAATLLLLFCALVVAQFLLPPLLAFHVASGTGRLFVRLTLTGKLVCLAVAAGAALLLVYNLRPEVLVA